MPETESWTIGRLLNWTKDYFQTRDIENARLDAEVLLAEARGCQRIELYTAFDEPADEQTRVAFRELVRRRAEGMPVAYLVGRREFYAMTFYVTPDVLIPRPETEFLVVALLDLAKTQNRTQEQIEIADVGTGSGVLAICGAKNLPLSRVTAIDVSPAALAVARRNCDLHAVSDQVDLVESNLMESIPDGKQFDFIVSNPPYVSQAEYEALPGEVKNHEPRSALFAGPVGTETIEQLIPQAASHLKPGGWIIMELSPMIADRVADLFRVGDRWDNITMVKDLAGHQRLIQAQRA